MAQTEFEESCSAGESSKQADAQQYCGQTSWPSHYQSFTCGPDDGLCFKCQELQGAQAADTSDPCRAEDNLQPSGQEVNQAPARSCSDLSSPLSSDASPGMRFGSYVMTRSRPISLAESHRSATSPLGNSGEKDATRIGLGTDDATDAECCLAAEDDELAGACNYFDETTMQTRRNQVMPSATFEMNCKAGECEWHESLNVFSKCGMQKRWCVKSPLGSVRRPMPRTTEPTSSPGAGYRNVPVMADKMRRVALPKSRSPERSKESEPTPLSQSTTGRAGSPQCSSVLRSLRFRAGGGPMFERCSVVRPSLLTAPITKVLPHTQRHGEPIFSATHGGQAWRATSLLRCVSPEMLHRTVNAGQAMHPALPAAVAPGCDGLLFQNTALPVSSPVRLLSSYVPFHTAYPTLLATREHSHMCPSKSSLRCPSREPLKARQSSVKHI